MRNIFLMIILYFIGSCCYGQQSKLMCGDTSFWYNLEHKKNEELKLDHLIESTDSFHFRYRSGGQIVEVWSKDGRTDSGFVINYAWSYIPSDDKKKLQKKAPLFITKIFLDSAELKKATEAIRSISGIPTDSQITGWKQGLDGITYIFETSTQSTYCFKTYWTPTSQDSALAEAKTIQKFVVDIRSSLGLSKKYDDFFKSQKPGSYTTSDGWINIKLSPKEVAYNKKMRPYREYLKSVADTLNQYLSDTLNMMFKGHDEIKYYGTYVLTFSKKNKLLKVTAKSQPEDNEERKEYMKGRKWIINAFIKIKVDFVHSKIDYSKDIDLSADEIIVN